MSLLSVEKNRKECIVYALISSETRKKIVGMDDIVLTIQKER